jgi:hypothetical protein
MPRHIKELCSNLIESKKHSLIRVQNNFLFDFDLVQNLLFLQRFQQIFCSRTFGSFFLFLFSLLGEFGFLLFFHGICKKGQSYQNKLLLYFVCLQFDILTFGSVQNLLADRLKITFKSQFTKKCSKFIPK